MTSRVRETIYKKTDWEKNNVKSGILYYDFKSWIVRVTFSIMDHVSCILNPSSYHHLSIERLILFHILCCIIIKIHHGS
jgi:hypothetical protein